MNDGKVVGQDEDYDFQGAREVRMRQDIIAHN